MRKVIRILRREYSATIRTKAFIIGLVIAPIMMGGSTIIFAVFKDRVDVHDKRIAVIDRSGLVARAIVMGAERRNAVATHDPDSGKKVRPAYVIEIVPPEAEHPEALHEVERRGVAHQEAALQAPHLEVGPTLEGLVPHQVRRVLQRAEAPRTKRRTWRWARSDAHTEGR